MPEGLTLEGGPDDDARLEAMQEKYRGKTILVREIVDSPRGHAAVPVPEEGAGPPSLAARHDDDAMARARERLARLRGEF